MKYNNYKHHSNNINSAIPNDTTHGSSNLESPRVQISSWRSLQLTTTRLSAQAYSSRLLPTCGLLRQQASIKEDPATNKSCYLSLNCTKLTLRLLRHHTTTEEDQHIPQFLSLGGDSHYWPLNCRISIRDSLSSFIASSDFGSWERVMWLLRTRRVCAYNWYALDTRIDIQVISIKSITRTAN